MRGHQHEFKHARTCEALENRCLLTAVPFADPASISSPAADWTGQAGEIAFTDLDADGDLDLLQAGSYRGERGAALWRLNEGNGSFGEPTIQEFSFSGHALLGDLDGNGRLDLIARQSGGYFWFNNTGDPTQLFESDSRPVVEGTSAVGLQLSSVADLNNDGRNDLLFLQVAPQRRAVWLENLGPEGFVVHEIYQSNQRGPRLNLVARDIDADDDLDLIFIDRQVRVFENLGSASPDLFDEPVAIAWDKIPMAAEAFDADADGDQDLLLFPTRSFVDFATYWSENDDGNFQEPIELEAFDGAPRIEPIGTSFYFDTNNDGTPEPVIANRFGGLMWYESGGNEIQQWEARERLVTATSGDIDGDGDTDWGVTNLQGNRVSWYDSLESDSTQNEIAKTDLFLPRHLNVVDMDADGDSDAVISSRGELHWYENLGASQFAPISTLGARRGSFDGILDLNGDARPDLIQTFVEDGVHVTEWLPNLGSDLGQPNRLPRATPLNHFLDIDGDGDADYIAFESQAENPTTAYFNDGLGNFTSPKTLPIDFYSPLFQSDMDSDGDLDLLETTGTTLRIYENRGDGEYLPAENDSLPSFQSSLADVQLFDLDNDGDDDVVASYNPRASFPGTKTKVEIWKNDQGAFALEKEVEFNGQLWNELIFKDLDGDGDPEITTLVDGKPAYLENLGSLQFESVRQVPFPNAEIDNFNELVISDVDGDGLQDFVLVDISYDRLSVMLNRLGTGQAPITAVEIDLVHEAIRLGSQESKHDWNTDGRVDVADVDHLLGELGTVRGDSDLDGDVDFLDFLAMSLSFGEADRGWRGGDFDGDGTIGFSDFLFVSANFGFFAQ